MKKKMKKKKMNEGNEEAYGSVWRKKRKGRWRKRKKKKKDGPGWCVLEVVVECEEGKRKEREKKMKEDGKRVTMGVFGKWQCRGKGCGEKKNGREKIGWSLHVGVWVW